MKLKLAPFTVNTITRGFVSGPERKSTYAGAVELALHSLRLGLFDEDKRAVHQPMTIRIDHTRWRKQRIRSTPIIEIEIFITGKTSADELAHGEDAT